MAVILLLGLTGCAQTASKVSYRQITPVDFTFLTVVNESDTASSFPPGRYTFSVSRDQDSETAAVYSIYVSDYLYQSMNSELAGNFVCTIRPGDSQTLNLENGNYVYIAATSLKTGVYEENLEGNLSIARN